MSSGLDMAERMGELAADYRRLAAENVALRELLGRHGRHLAHCTRARDHDRECTCGYSQALRRLGCGAVVAGEIEWR